MNQVDAQNDKNPKDLSCFHGSSQEHRWQSKYGKHMIQNYNDVTIKRSIVQSIGSG